MEFSLGEIFVGGIFVGGIFVGGIFLEQMVQAATGGDDSHRKYLLLRFAGDITLLYL